MSWSDVVPCSHKPPYKRIMIGHDNPVPETPAGLSIAEGMAVAAKASEAARIWKLVEQSSQGSALPAKVTARPAEKSPLDWVTHVIAPYHVGDVVTHADGTAWIVKHIQEHVPVDIKTLDWTRLAETDA